MRLLVTLLLAFFGVLVACSDSTSEPEVSEPNAQPGWTPYDLQVTGSRADQRFLNAERARATLFNRLISTLTTEMEENGAASAIEVCSTEAPALAATVSAELGVRIGRTGVRLRNPENAGPAWAAEAIAEKSTKMRAWTHQDGTMAVLAPIQMATTCLKCHGGADDLAEGVPEALLEHYPEDAATGFAKGELRGWFWVESPVGP